MTDNVFLIIVTIMLVFYILANVIDVFVLEMRLNKQVKIFQENYDKSIRADEIKKFKEWFDEYTCLDDLFSFNDVMRIISKYEQAISCDYEKYRKTQEDLFNQALADERRKFAKWLDKKAYLCGITYSMDEDSLLNVMAENLDVDKVLNEYEREDDLNE